MSNTTVSVREPGTILAGPEGAAPGWFAEERAAAWRRFSELPMPVRTDERWRFSGVNRLSLEGFRPAAEPGREEREAALERSGRLAHSAGRMVFVNDRLAAREASEELAAKGVVWAPVSEAVAAHPGLLREHFMAHFTGLGAEKFAHLHRAFVRDGVFVYVPANVELEAPIENFYWVSGERGAVFPHTLVIAGVNAKVTVVDHYLGLPGAGAALACGVNDLFAGDGAKITYVSAQYWPEGSLSFHFNSTIVGRDSSVTGLSAHLGGAFSRSESVSHLTAPGGRSDMLAVTLATGDQEFDQRTLQDHQQPNTSSDLLYKNALDHTSRTIFSGLIKVEPGAHRTDAYQKVRNLMLSDEAEANSMPGLEILADDVRCTHGATTGQIEPEELFYLKSRGLDDFTARRLIANGFLEEVFDRIEQPEIAKKLAGFVEAKFDATHARAAAKA